MGRLVINEYGKDAREVKISQDEINIGRDPRGEIVLEDIGVSRSHARILRQEGKFLLEDLGSRNGTIVNDQKLPVKGTYALRHGDIIRVGRSVLRMILRISKRISTRLKKLAGADAREAETGEGGGLQRDSPLCLFRLQKIEAGLLVCEEGRVPAFHALRSDRVRIGRSPGSDIVLSDPTVCAEHAEIVYNREGFHIVDRDSTLGTYLDGVSVRLARLGHRSFLRFGKLKALFLVREEGKDPPEATFDLRDHLIGLYPERAEKIRRAFQECREHALDFARELVERGALDPEEFWAAMREFQERPPSGPRGWVSRILGRSDRGS